MNWFNIDNYSLENHHFNTYIPEGATKLIVGTFPTYHVNYKNTFKWFYAGEKNNFWKVFDEVFKPQFKFTIGDEAIIERKEYFEIKHIGITDIIEVCYRKNKSSSDTDLYPVILMDINKLLDENPSITKLILTSRSGVISALGLIKIYFLQRKLILERLNKRKDKILEGFFSYKGREIKVLVPYSTSPKLIEDGITNMPELISMYQKCLA